MDVADKQDVIRLHEELSKTMPPIAGVVNGAMVLADGLFSDMSLETFEKVLRPKVIGSNHLDEVFSSKELDFFIMFSSLSAVVGNPGQANYAAANMVMYPLTKTESLAMILTFFFTYSTWLVLQSNAESVD